jgi:bilirubin oxidase
MPTGPCSSRRPRILRRRLKADLQIPFIPRNTCDGNPSDVSPIWNPEFFGNTMMVNGNTWPYLDVEQRRYRFRFLNACNARTLLLKLDRTTSRSGRSAATAGILPQPAQLAQTADGSAERADVIVDFTTRAVGTTITLLNIGPDSPFGGGVRASTIRRRIRRRPAP